MSKFVAAVAVTTMVAAKIAVAPQDKPKRKHTNRSKYSNYPTFKFIFIFKKSDQSKCHTPGVSRGDR